MIGKEAARWTEESPGGHGHRRDILLYSELIPSINRFFYIFSVYFCDLHMLLESIELNIQVQFYRTLVWIGSHSFDSVAQNSWRQV